MLFKGPNRKWQLELHDTVLAAEISRELGVGALLAAVLLSRGASSVQEARDFLAAGDADLADARLLPDADKAVERVGRALSRGERIAVHGHDDADGVCATAIMVEALTQLGAVPTTYIPDRRREGHGLSRGEIDLLAAASTDLILTVDSCVSERELISYADGIGIDTVVTDHHEIPPELPDAVAVINPKLPDSRFPYRYMAGVGVSLRLAELLLEELGPRGGSGDSPPWFGERWPDEAVALAAVGSVADRVPLTGENRKIVARGREALARTERVGLRAMLEESGLWGEAVEPSDIQEYLGPIFGRVSDGNGGNEALVALLTSDDELARGIVRKLVEERARWRRAAADAWRTVTRAMGDKAGDAALLFVETEVPVGVLGYVASRLADTSGRPSVVVAPKRDEVMAEARGPYGFDLVAAFRTMSSLFLGYGGHPRAGGFSAPAENVPEIGRRLVAYAAENPPDPPPRQIDAQCDLLDLRPESADELELLRPFGFGNGRAVLLARRVTGETIDEARKRGVHLGTPSRFGNDARDVVYRVRSADGVVLVNVLETVEERPGA